MRRTTVRSLAAFFAVWLAACTTWSRPAPLDRVLLEKRPRWIRVTLTDGRQVHVLRPVVQGDTLVGDTLEYRGGEAYRKHPARIPLAEVRAASTRAFGAGETVALLIGVGVVTLVVVGVTQSVQHGIMGGDLGGSGCSGGK